METEEEQVEKLKAWFKENGLSIVFGVIIGGGGIIGYNLWISMQEAQAVKASEHYSKMLDALQEGKTDAIQSHAERLIAEHGSSDYALMAQLALAKSHIAKDAFDQAELALQQIVASAGQNPLAYVARVRLAAVQIQTKQYEPALVTLEVEFPPQFAARVAELRGDIYALQGNNEAAAAAYRIAQSAQPGPPNHEFLQQKLDDLGVGS